MHGVNKPYPYYFHFKQKETRIIYANQGNKKQKGNFSVKKGRGNPLQKGISP